MKSNTPLVSIVIVNYNGIHWLKTCLESIYRQTYINFEIIFVDNNSSDKSVEFVNSNFPKVNVILNKKNEGFAKGNNIGISIAKGKYYFLLNNDTNLIEIDLIEKSLNFLNKNSKVGSLQPKICLLDNPKLIDLCGSFWTPTTVLYHFGFHQEESSKIFNKNFPVFTCKGAAMFVRKKCVEEIGLFDEDFWCYYEETDFCHRAWMAGWESWYFSESKLLHANGGTSSTFDSDFIQFHNFKNKLRSFIKNFHGKERIIILSKFTLVSFIFCIFSLITGRPKNILSIIMAYIWNINKLTQSTHIKSYGEIPPYVIVRPKLRYYIDLLKNLKNHDYSKDI